MIERVWKKTQRVGKVGKDMKATEEKEMMMTTVRETNLTIKTAELRGLGAEVEVEVGELVRMEIEMDTGIAKGRLGNDIASQAKVEADEGERAKDRVNEAVKTEKV